jgi:hypothetical protein
MTLHTFGALVFVTFALALGGLFALIIYLLGAALLGALP